jgi:hypothetical protein
MVTFAQAQERAEEWINGDVPAYQHREVRVREFELGFVVWAEDRAEGPRSDGGAQRLVIARDSGEATLWPSLPVGEVIRRYEEEYGRPEGAGEPAPAAAARVDLNQTSFLLSPPEWLQEAADKLGIPDRRGGAPASAGSASGNGEGWPQAGAGGGAAAPAGATPWAGTDTNADSGEDRSVPLPATVFAPPLSESDQDTPPEAETALMAGGSRLPRTTVAPSLGDQGPQPLADTAPYGYPQGTPGTPPPGAPAPGAAPPPPPPSSYGYPQAGGGAPVPGAPMPGATPPPPPPGSSAPGVTPPPGATAPPSYGYPQAAGGAVPGAPVPGATPPPSGSSVPGAAPPPPPPPPPGASVPGVTPSPPPPSYGYPQGPGGASGAGQPQAPQPPGRPLAPNAGDIADAATSKAAPPPRRGSTTPHPPGAPGAPGARPGSAPPPPPGAPGGGGYVPTQLVSALGPDGPEGVAGPPGAPDSPGGTPPGGVHHAATMLADPGQMGPGGGAPQPPGAPGAQAFPGAPVAPGAQGGPAGGRGGAVHHAETVLAAPPVGGPGAPPPPQAPGMSPGAPMPPGAVPPPAYGYPQQQGQPTVGPGYQAVLRYRAQDGSEQQLIRRSAPGTPHPEWQIFHELRGMNVPPNQVLELHTELESCELPGAYCARMIREQWPQARITSIAPYGTDHASRQQGMRQLLAHQGELHQVADGPARPAPVRAPLPPVQAAPPIPPEGVAQELAGAFGPGIFRFEQQAVSRQGVPPVVAHSLVVAGLPMDMGPFFWAQAQPGRPVPTLAELAQERGVQPAADAGSYLVMGSDFGRAVCVQYGTANIVAVPVEAGPGGVPVPPQFVNTGLPELQRCLALLGRMWRLRFGLNQEQAGRWTVDFQAQLASLDPAALGSPESWWSVLLEQMWDGLL